MILASILIVAYLACGLGAVRKSETCLYLGDMLRPLVVRTIMVIVTINAIGLGLKLIGILT